MCRSWWSRLPCLFRLRCRTRKSCAPCLSSPALSASAAYAQAKMASGFACTQSTRSCSRRKTSWKSVAPFCPASRRNSCCRTGRTTMSNQPLVVYHANCADGFTAAWACWTRHPDWEYRPMAYGDGGLGRLVRDVVGRDVYFLDFCLTKQQMWQIRMVADKLVVLHHHKTAEAELNGLEEEMRISNEDVEVVFDMERSGAGSAWDDV